jgi:hypothetical protein
MGAISGPNRTEKTMLGVILTIWLLLQLPLALMLGRFIACPQKRRAAKRGESRRPTLAPPRTRAA